MFSKKPYKYNKILLVLIIILCFTFNANGQINLLSAINSGCSKTLDAYPPFKPILKQTWLKDDILQIQTVAPSNCDGVQNPRIELFGPLVYLNFDGYGIITKIDPELIKK